MRSQLQKQQNTFVLEIKKYMLVNLHTTAANVHANAKLTLDVDELVSHQTSGFLRARRARYAMDMAVPPPMKKNRGMS